MKILSVYHPIIFLPVCANLVIVILYFYQAIKCTQNTTTSVGCAFMIRCSNVLCNRSWFLETVSNATSHTAQSMKCMSKYTKIYLKGWYRAVFYSKYKINLHDYFIQLFVIWSISILGRTSLIQRIQNLISI